MLNYQNDKRVINSFRNIQRGRDHGLPSYGEMKRWLNISDSEHKNIDEATKKELLKVYRLVKSRYKQCCGSRMFILDPES